MLSSSSSSPASSSFSPGHFFNGTTKNVNINEEDGLFPHRHQQRHILVHQQPTFDPYQEDCLEGERPSQKREFVVKCMNSPPRPPQPPPPYQCARCGQPIMDSHLAKIFPPADRFLHQHCARCSVCHCPLLLLHLVAPHQPIPSVAAKCFEREGRLYCQMHYMQYFPQLPQAAAPTCCAGCQIPIGADDVVYKLKAGIVFHLRCHRCVHCGRQLAQGEQIVVDERSKAVACAAHFGNILAGMVATADNDDEMEPIVGFYDQNGTAGQVGNITGQNGPPPQMVAQMCTTSTNLMGAEPSTSSSLIAEQMMQQKEAQIGQQELANAQRRMMLEREEEEVGRGGGDDEGFDHQFGHQMEGEPTPQNAVDGIEVLAPNRVDKIQPEFQVPQSSTFKASIASSQQCHGTTVETFNGGEDIEAEGQICQEQQAANDLGMGGCGETRRQMGDGRKRRISSIDKCGGASSPSSWDQQQQNHSLLLDGVVLSTVQNIKAAIEQQRSAANGGGGEGGGEETRKKRKKSDGGGKRGPEKGTAEGRGGVAKTRTSTPIPVPQYPFEMYAAGEQFSRQEEESQQKAQGNKRRGPRTTISQQQLDILNCMFAATPKPSKHARAKLAMDAGLSMRVIQVWFQNRRSKERRLKHLCNFLRHCDSGGAETTQMGGEDSHQEEEEEGAEEEEEEDEEGGEEVEGRMGEAADEEANNGGMRPMMATAVKQEERSEFDEPGGDEFGGIVGEF